MKFPSCPGIWRARHSFAVAAARIDAVNTSLRNASSTTVRPLQRGHRTIAGNGGSRRNRAISGISPVGKPTPLEVIGVDDSPCLPRWTSEEAESLCCLSGIAW